MSGQSRGKERQAKIRRKGHVSLSVAIIHCGTGQETGNG